MCSTTACQQGLVTLKNNNKKNSAFSNNVFMPKPLPCCFEKCIITLNDHLKTSKKNPTAQNHLVLIGTTRVCFAATHNSLCLSEGEGRCTPALLPVTVTPGKMCYHGNMLSMMPLSARSGISARGTNHTLSQDEINSLHRDLCGQFARLALVIFSCSLFARLITMRAAADGRCLPSLTGEHSGRLNL